MSSYLLSKSVKIKIYSTIILFVVLFEHETWSVPLREGYGLRVLVTRVLRNVLAGERDVMIGNRGKFIIGSYMVCALHRLLFGSSGQGE